MTWAKLSAIKANLAIELTFDECLKTVKVTYSCWTSVAHNATRLRPSKLLGRRQQHLHTLNLAPHFFYRSGRPARRRRTSAAGRCTAA